MTEVTRGVLHTSVVIDRDQIIAEQLPDESAITAVTLAEPAAGPVQPKIKTSAHGARTVCSGATAEAPRQGLSTARRRRCDRSG